MGGWGLICRCPDERSRFIPILCHSQIHSVRTLRPGEHETFRVKQNNLKLIVVVCVYVCILCTCIICMYVLYNVCMCMHVLYVCVCVCTCVVFPQLSYIEQLEGAEGGAQRLMLPTNKQEVCVCVWRGRRGEGD